jgi:hypothetical protein
MRVVVLATVFAALPSFARADAAFTTSAEVKPVLELTRASWVGLQETETQDVLWFSHLEGLRCGIASVRYGLNGAAAETPWTLAPCNRDSADPVLFDTTAHPPYAVLPAQTVQSIAVHLEFDDGSTLDGVYPRAAMILP